MVPDGSDSAEGEFYTQQSKKMSSSAHADVWT